MLYFDARNNRHNMNKKLVISKFSIAMLSGILSIIFFFLLLFDFPDKRIKYALVLLAETIIIAFILFFKGNVRIEDELQKQMRLEIYAQTQRYQMLLFVFFIVVLNLFTWNFITVTLTTFYLITNVVVMLAITTTVKRKYR